jgi:succinoglycan biosynthesis protein ExoA
VEFNERVHAVGLTCYFTPAAKIVYEPRKGLRALFYQLSRYGLGRARLAFKHPRSLTIPALIPPLWLVWLLVGGLASLFVPHLGAVWLASIGLYVAVLLAMGLALGRGRGVGVALRIPLVFMAIHLGFAWGFWKEVARQVRMGVGWRIGSPRTSPPAGAS